MNSFSHRDVLYLLFRAFPILGTLAFSSQRFIHSCRTSTAGTERYVRNAAVWLLNLEARVPNMNAERLDTSHRQLRRGESITLEGDLGRIMIGMGW